MAKEVHIVMTVLRFLLAALYLLPGAAPLSGVTMQQLSMDDLAVKSTAIVRGRVLDSYTTLLGPTVYTHYRVAVADTWKGATASTVDVALPGGTAAGIRQTYPGIPQLAVGRDYVIYLWTSSVSGITMPTGFNQGIFAVTGATPASLLLSRSATSELMLNSTGRPVQDQAVSMRLSEMKSRVAVALSRVSSVR